MGEFVKKDQKWGKNNNYAENGDKNIAKGDDRLSDGTMDEKKSPTHGKEGDWRAKPGGMQCGAGCR